MLRAGDVADGRSAAVPTPDQGVERLACSHLERGDAAQREDEHPDCGGGHGRPAPPGAALAALPGSLTAGAGIRAVSVRTGARIIIAAIGTRAGLTCTVARAVAESLRGLFVARVFVARIFVARIFVARIKVARVFVARIEVARVFVARV